MGKNLSSNNGECYQNSQSFETPFGAEYNRSSFSENYRSHGYSKINQASQFSTETSRFSDQSPQKMRQYEADRNFSHKQFGHSSTITDSRAQYQGQKGRQIQDQFRSKIAGPSIPLRKTGADMAGSDTTFELCFILDSTGSMGNWITRAQETINEMIDNLIYDNKHMGNTIVRISLIGYRDVLDQGRFMELPFTQNINDVKDFLQSIDATSMEQNIDRPEDVAGAFKMCLMQDWTFESVKRVVLIGDAPAHGYYYSPYANQDNYPKGTPDVPTLRQLTREFRSKEIALQVVKLDDNMTSMVKDIASVDPELDVVDMTYLQEEIQSEYDDELDDLEDKQNNGEQESKIRRIFVQATNEGMQTQMRQRFKDREALRKLKKGIHETCL